jgi:hypothetical protein
MRRDMAETIALQALAWLVGNDDLMPVFLGSSGACEADLKSGADDPAFLAAVLDFVMMDDAWVISFCDSAGLAYTAPSQARAALPGAAVEHWT